MGFILNIIVALAVFSIQPLRNSAEVISSVIWLVFKFIQLILIILEWLIPKILMQKLNYVPTMLGQVTKMVALKMIDLVSPMVLQLIIAKIKNSYPVCGNFSGGVGIPNPIA